MASRMKAYSISDGDVPWFVRGTDNPEEALNVLLEEYPEAADDAPEDEGVDYEIYPQVERAGWFRFSPCNCGDHGWHLDNASGPGRGQFLGVALDVGYTEEHFLSDVGLTDSAPSDTLTA